MTERIVSQWFPLEDGCRSGSGGQLASAGVQGGNSAAGLGLPESVGSTE